MNRPAAGGIVGDVFRPAPPSLPADLSTVRRCVWTTDGARLHLDLAGFAALAGRLQPVTLWHRPGALAAVERLHAEVPADRHEHWSRAAPYALKLLRSDNPDRPLRPFERVQPGGVSPWVPALGAVLGEVTGLAMRVLTGDAKWLLVGPAFGLTLGFAAWWKARGGERRVVAAAPADRAGGFLLAAAAVVWLATIPAMALMGQIGVLPGWAVLLGVGGPVVFAVAVGLGMIRLSRDFHAARRAEAAEEWAALRSDPQRTPAWQVGLWDDGETRSDPDASERPGR